MSNRSRWDPHWWAAWERSRADLAPAARLRKVVWWGGDPGLQACPEIPFPSFRNSLWDALDLLTGWIRPMRERGNGEEGHLGSQALRKNLVTYLTNNVCHPYRSGKCI